MATLERGASSSTPDRVRARTAYRSMKRGPPPGSKAGSRPTSGSGRGRRLAMKKPAQRSMHCRCGRSKIVAHGLCGTCYTPRRQDEEHFGGLREAVLERDGYRYRVCDASGRGKRPITVHHRVPGRSVMSLMLALCPGCHARVHRTKAMLSAMPPLLLALWREQHPKGHEQGQLDFTSKRPAAQLIPLFGEEQEAACYAGHANENGVSQDL